MKLLKISKNNGDRFSINLDRLAYAMIFPKTVHFFFDSGLKISISEGDIGEGEFGEILKDLGFMGTADIGT